jgi:methionyl-tRNA synthetase
MDKKKYLITSALPYANGYIHLGHIAGAYLPADMYVRYRRLRGDDILFIGGSDEHGTAIEISAMKENVTPREIIDRYHFANKDAFEKLGISFDIYSRTSTAIHQKTAQDFFMNLYNKGLLYKRKEKQLYSEKDKRFLADRFVEGTCPICGYEEARGDQCENCGSNLSPFELINPKSKISGDTPVIKESEHFYFPLEKFQPLLEKWLGTKTNWKANVRNYCDGWFKTGLKDRAITRDLDWGVKVPLEGYEGKVIYVWFEAVLGYISNTKEYFISKNEPEERWKEYWNGEDSKLIHFIGKDNIIFHAILFPAMIMAHGDINLPDNVPANEFLNVEGGKFSKSKGKGSLVKDIVEEYNPDLVRYVIASNLPENKDSEFTMDDLRIKNNNELAAILGNFINRTVVFAKSKFDNVIPDAGSDGNNLILNEIKSQASVVADCYENFRFRDALTETMNIVRMANKYFNDSEPWNLIKNDKTKCASVINNCLQICMHIAIAIKPLLPFTTAEILKILNADESLVKWDNIGERLLAANAKLGENKILYPQIEKPIEEITEKEEDNLIDIDYFKKINLRVAKVIECERIEKSKKLLKLKIKIDDREKQIVAGVAEFYSPEDLIGKNIAVVDNLKKSKLMGVESQGMLLAAKKDGKLKVVFIDPAIPDGGEIS